MPRYKLTDPQTGTVFHLTGDSPPTEAEATEAFQGAALNKALKGRGFNQEPPQEEFLSKFRNIGSLLGGAMSTPAGAAMVPEIPGVAGAVSAAARPVMRMGGKAIAGAARAAEYLPIPSALAPKTRTLKLLQALGGKAGEAGKTASTASNPLRSAKRLVLTPEEIAQATQHEAMAKMEAQRRGMRHAAYGSKGTP